MSELCHLELLEPSFGTDSPTLLTRTQLFVSMDPSVGFVTRYAGKSIHIHIIVIEQTFGV